MREASWKNQFPDVYTKIRSQYPQELANESSLIYLACKEKLIDSKTYLNWAQQHFGIAILEEKFFQEKFTTEAFVKYAKLANWSKEYLPVFEWDGVLFLACLDPYSFHHLKLDITIRPLLTTYENLRFALEKIRLLRDKIKSTAKQGKELKPEKDQASKASSTSPSPSTAQPKKVNPPKLPPPPPAHPPAPKSQPPSAPPIATKPPPPLKTPPPMPKDDKTELIASAKADDKTELIVREFDPHADLGKKPIDEGFLTFEAMMEQGAEDFQTSKPKTKQKKVEEEFEIPQGLDFSDGQQIIEPKPKPVAKPVAKPASKPVSKILNKNEPPPLPPTEPVQSRKKVGNVDDFTLSSYINTIGQVYKYYEKLMILKVNSNDTAEPIYWDRGFESNGKNSIIPLHQPSPFRIAFKTAKAFHGPLSMNFILEKFCEDWLSKHKPNLLSVIPLQDEGTVFCLLVGVSENKQDSSDALHYLFQLGNEIATEITREATRTFATQVGR